MIVLPDTRFCNCCAPAVVPAPATIWNRPGLSAVDYRIGTFASFRQAMLDEVHRYTELTGLLTRQSDDHAVTFVELFAALGDVLTFYNERIANEMYLGQALHKLSVEQLVALVGYIPRPALSAMGAVAFEIETGKSTRLWRGLKVMSIPGPDETAQTFETLEEIQGAGRLNAAPVFAPFQGINAFDQGRRRAPVLGDPELTAGDAFLIFGGGAVEEKTVETVTAEAGGTYLNWTPAVQNNDIHTRFVRAAAKVRRLRFFGHDAPTSYKVYDTDPAIPPQNRWKDQPIDPAISDAVDQYPLAARVDDLKPGAHLLLDAGGGVPSDEPRLRTARVSEIDEGPAMLPQAPVAGTPALSDTVSQIRVRRTIAGRPTAVALPAGLPLVLMRDGGGTPAYLLGNRHAGRNPAAWRSAAVSHVRGRRRVWRRAAGCLCARSQWRASAQHAGAVLAILAGSGRAVDIGTGAGGAGGRAVPGVRARPGQRALGL